MNSPPVLGRKRVGANGGDLASGTENQSQLRAGSTAKRAVGKGEQLTGCEFINENRCISKMLQLALQLGTANSFS